MPTKPKPRKVCRAEYDIQQCIFRSSSTLEGQCSLFSRNRICIPTHLNTAARMSSDAQMISSRTCLNRRGRLGVKVPRIKPIVWSVSVSYLDVSVGTRCTRGTRTWLIRESSVWAVPTSSVGAGPLKACVQCVKSGKQKVRVG
jgi:hypothetical protein